MLSFRGRHAESGFLTPFPLGLCSHFQISLADGEVESLGREPQGASQVHTVDAAPRLVPGVVGLGVQVMSPQPEPSSWVCVESRHSRQGSGLSSAPRTGEGEPVWRQEVSKRLGFLWVLRGPGAPSTTLAQLPGMVGVPARGPDVQKLRGSQN